ncbi:SMI1/KNR4 family protein [Streptomyces sp. HUAS TT20]|uniref:SMI1/KNR4 family protein n=1 Tax=Streptomyces sp. HUAS TT20 TaxID=3447509 RepID=UPI0021DB65A4|nr:SMI1/KNR4 family protein [Streptomyces sp. HUAS 15-9]UXY25580.1 SMI1/KNR4 family protein [Streptomyces sp. HUAS 15-9]
MDEQELLAAVHLLVARGGQDLVCDQVGHATGHMCLTADEDIDPAAFGEILSGRYARSRTLAADGHVDPTSSERAGASLLAPFGDRLVSMRVWTYADRWIGCGTVRAGVDVRPVVLVAGRVIALPDGLPELPEDASWVDRVVAVTGWSPERIDPVDWSTAETRLGTVLPGDYKELVERFGGGAFDGYLSLLLPGGVPGGLDIAEFNEFWARAADSDGYGPWDPYRVYPASGGLLQWARTEQRTSFYWVTEGADPDCWPILVADDAHCEWDRFDGSTAEFVHRLLTDPSHPCSTARYFDSHWFMTYERPDRGSGE